MSFFKKTLQIFFLFIVIAILSCSCSSTRKNPYYQKKRVEASKSNTKQLGRNRYYFSNTYQKKLAKSYKRKKY